MTEVTPTRYGSAAIPEAKHVIEPTSQSTIDEALAILQDYKKEWAELDKAALTCLLVAIGNHGQFADERFGIAGGDGLAQSDVPGPSRREERRVRLGLDRSDSGGANVFLCTDELRCR